MAPKMCDHCPKATYGFKGHLVIVLLLLLVHYIFVVLSICSEVSWTRGLTAYGQMISKVPSAMPTMLWLIKLMYVYAAVFTCVIGTMLWGVYTKNGRLIRMTAAVQFVLVAMQLSTAISVGAFYAEFLRPKLESPDVLTEAAARYNQSFETVYSYSRDLFENVFSSYRLIYVSDTNWFVRLDCGKVAFAEDSGSRMRFATWQIRGCYDEFFLDSVPRVSCEIFALPAILITGTLIAWLSQQQVSFFVQREEKLSCEKSQFFSPSALNIECGSLCIKFQTPSDIVQIQNAEEAATAEEGERLETEQVQSAAV